MENRRNYYRLLQVQPDAPQALIKSSYRTLMQKLKYHPDLGGDHWNATLINEAFYVLSNEQRRAEYDATLGEALFHRAEGEVTVAPVSEDTAKSSVEGTQCPFCRTINPTEVLFAESFCFECNSPLAAVEISTIDQELRRAISRVTINDDVQYYTAWPQNPHIGHLNDVSPVGMGIVVDERLVIGEIIKIECMFLSAIGQIVHIAEEDKPNEQILGVKLLTASFHCDQGTFLNIAI